MNEFMNKYEEEMKFLVVPLFEIKENASHRQPTDGWDIYATGYKSAADAIVEHLDEKGHHRALMVHPVVFLYRHYLELRLKELLLKSSQLLESKTVLPLGHNLMQLWGKLRPNLELFGRSQETEELYGSIEDRLKEITQIDSGSMAFRYPVDTTGRESLPQDPGIDLLLFRNVMKAIANLLDGASVGLYEYLQQKWEAEDNYSQEMEAEYRSAMEAEYQEAMSADYYAEQAAMEAEYRSAMEAEHRDYGY